MRRGQGGRPARAQALWLTSRRAALLAALPGGALASWPALAAAHPGRALAPHDAWRAWTFEPAEVPALLLAAWLYARGVRALWRRAGRGAGIRRWEAACFAAGWVVLALALVSPVHAMGAVLFTAHMVQHELLMVLAAPLLVLGRPVVAMVWALPPAWRRAAGRATRAGAWRTAWAALSGPAAATVLHGAAIWLWHVPSVYQATLRSDAVHAAQHATFVGTALLFWWAVLSPRARRGHPGPAVLALFVTTVHTGLLGVLLAMAPRVWYPAYARTTLAWGLNALEDQQLAGLVMWIPASLAYVVAALALLSRLLGEGRRADTRVRRSAPSGVLRTGMPAWSFLPSSAGAPPSPEPPSTP